MANNKEAKVLTAEEIAHKYVHGLHDALTDNQEKIDMANDIKAFASLCVEQERKVWEKEKEYLQNKIHKYEHPFDHFLKNRSK